MNLFVEASQLFTFACLFFPLSPRYTQYETGNFEEHCELKRIKRFKQGNLMPKKSELSTSLRGRKVRVLWAQDEMYYQGRIVGKCSKTIGNHLVKYDDGDLMSHTLLEEIVQLELDDGSTFEEEEEEEDEEDEMEEEEEEMELDGEEEETTGMVWAQGDLVQCLAPNSRWYRATVEKVHEKTRQYDILYERSNTKESYVKEERVMEYIKFKDRSKKGTPKIKRQKKNDEESTSETADEEDDVF